MMISTLQKATEHLAAMLKSALEQTQHMGDLLKIQERETAMVVVDPFVMYLCVFVLALFVGYYVVWKVTPALHSPLMAVTNAISSVIILGGIVAAGISGSGSANFFGLLAIFLACVNIFGGFMVTWRMLAMFKRK
jgi:NAD(P) transhydrogenase subunit alpha